MKKILNPFFEFLSKYNIAICLLGIYALTTHALGIQNCLIKLCIGYPCPGCGMTRAALALLHLDFPLAFQMNPFIFLLPFVLVLIIFKEKSWAKKILHAKWIWISLTGIVLVAYILRFIYVYPDIPMDYNQNNLLSFIIALFQ